MRGIKEQTDFTVRVLNVQAAGVMVRYPGIWYIL